ncbi:MAG: PIG-L family deacetylase [Gemmatimonadota bacterium]
MGHSHPENLSDTWTATEVAAGQARQAVAPPPVPLPRPTLAGRPARAALPIGHPSPGPSLPESPAAGEAAAGPAGGLVPAVPPGSVLPAPLPPAVSVLAVIARPGQESADLGAVLAAFHLSGARLSLLCLTRGEASELNSTPDRLEAVRPWELQVAAGLLRVSSVTIADYPDGRLGFVPVTGLADYISRAIQYRQADLLLVVDPAAGPDPDTTAAAQAACLAARGAGLPVLARTHPGPGARWEIFLGDHAPAVRGWQRSAIRAHGSQQPTPVTPGPDAAGPGDPLPDHEVVRWLVSPAPAGQL